MDTPTLTRTVARHFIAHGWAVNREIAAPAPGKWGKATAGRRIDLIASRTSRRPGLLNLEHLAIEVKTTRGDFNADVRNPDKQAPWRTAAHRHAYAVPEGLVTKDDVPADCGLLVVSPDGGVRWEKRAPYTPTTPDMPWWLLKTALYRSGHAEATLAGWIGQARRTGDDVTELRATIEQLTRERDRHQGRADRATAEALAWRERYAEVAKDGIPCAHCGHGIRSGKWTSRRGFPEWSHVDPAHEAECSKIRDALAAARPRPDWASEDHRWWTPEPEPIYPAPPAVNTPQEKSA